MLLECLRLYTVEPLYYGYFGTLILFITEVSSIQRSFDTLQYYTGTQNGVSTTEVSAIQRFVREVPLYTIPLQINFEFILSSSIDSNVSPHRSKLRRESE